jgi:hypothetical protein
MTFFYGINRVNRSAGYIFLIKYYTASLIKIHQWKFLFVIKIKDAINRKEAEKSIPFICK